MLARLLTGILACVLLPLGVVFAVLDAGIGSVFLGAGIGMLLLFVLLQSRERARRARRTQRARAEVVEAQINHGVQLNHKRQLKLSLRSGGRTLNGTFMWLPSVQLRPGDAVEIEYDPEDPANFAPLVPPE